MSSLPQAIRPNISVHAQGEPKYLPEESEIAASGLESMCAILEVVARGGEGDRAGFAADHAGWFRRGVSDQRFQSHAGDAGEMGRMRRLSARIRARGLLGAAPRRHPLQCGWPMLWHVLTFASTSAAIDCVPLMAQGEILGR